MTDINTGWPHHDTHELASPPAVPPLMDAAACFATMAHQPRDSALWVFWWDQGVAALDAHIQAKAAQAAHAARLARLVEVARETPPPASLRDRVRGIGAAISGATVGREALPDETEGDVRDGHNTRSSDTNG